MIVSYYNKKDKCHYILDYSKGLKYVLSMEDYQLLCNFSLEKSIFRKLTKNYFGKEVGEIKENKIGLWRGTFIQPEKYRIMNRNRF